MNISTILYTSALTLALSAAAPLAVAASHDKPDADDAYHEMDKKENMDKKEYKNKKEYQDKKAYKERDDDKAMGGYGDGQPDTSGAGSDAPDAPAHVPGGTNPEGAPDYDRSVE